MIERKYHRKIIKKEKKGKIFLLPLKIIFCCFAFLTTVIFAAFFYYAKDFPRPEKFTERQLIESTKIYDRTGEILLYEIYGEEKRTVVPLDIIPSYLKEAVVAAEDAGFYHHYGVDLKGIVRAIAADFRIGSPVFGGSTIPQQLIRSTFLSAEKTAERKTKEIVLALELDRRYSKDQILGWYLNQVPFGENSYGVEAASQTYFGKSVKDITVPEAAILTALIQAPSRLSAEENREDLLARKDYVLDRMADSGYLTKTDAEKFKKEEINFIKITTQIKAPYFTLWVKQQVEKKYGEDFLKQNGLKIYTSLDWNDQQLAEKAAREGVAQNKSYGAYNAGVVAIDPSTGEILAMTVGTGNYYEPSFPEDCISGKDCLFDPKFNVVVGTEKSPGRQPGSSFKPFVYATAFSEGYSDKEVITDELTNFGEWGDKEYLPKNYDGLFRGPVTLRQSLAQSLNIPSIKNLYLIGTDNPPVLNTTNNFSGQESIFLEGLKKSIETAKNMGINTLNKPLSSYGPAIVLGGGEVKLLEITSAYGVFANEGLKVPPVSILKIKDSRGNIIEENKKTPKRVLEIETARIINDVLSDNNARTPIFGPNSLLYFDGYQVAAKTGTTQDYRDGWAIGYTPFIAIGVWVGNNDNTPMWKEPGVVLAGPIFHNLMQEFLLKYPKEEFTKPEDRPPHTEIRL